MAYSPDSSINPSNSRLPNLTVVTVAFIVLVMVVVVNVCLNGFDYDPVLTLSGVFTEGCEAF